MRWSNYVLSEFVAPRYAEFTEAEIPYLVDDFPQASDWLANFFLNSVLRVRLNHGIKQLVLGYLRRSTSAFHSYHQARENTLSFLEKRNRGEQPVRLYYSSMDSWENFALQSSMAMDLYRHLNSGKGAFEKNDGSNYQRLWDIANQIKHTASCVASGQCTEKDTIPLWLSNQGLESFGISISFTEASVVLTDIAKLAEQIQDTAFFLPNSSEENSL